MAILCKFLDEFFNIINESRAWEFWLAKNTGKSWEEFSLEIIPQKVHTEELIQAQIDIETALAKGVINNGAF